MNTLQRLHAEQDQSPWIDFIDRELIDSGKLAERVERAGRGDPDRQGPRHPGHRRPRREPHLGQAPVVPFCSVEQGVPAPRLLRLAG